MFGRFGVTARFVALATVWGASFLFIKVGLEGLSPAQVALA
ncbi:MAG: EamA family transporter, partial [Acidimicrobiales bacterium]